MLRAEANRFPKVAALLDRAADLTDEDIDTADVPMAWYRQALKQVRDKERFARSVEEMKSNMDGDRSFFRHGANPSIKGTQALYVGAETWIKMFQSELRLDTGTLLFFPVSGGVWVNCSFGPKANAYRLSTQCRDAVETTLDQYKSVFNQRLCGQYPGAPMTVDLNARAVAHGAGSGLGHLADLGVRFQ